MKPDNPFHTLACALGLCLLVAGANATAASGFHEGLWHYTMKMDMPNMPAMPDMSKIDASKLPPGLKLPQADGHGMTMSFEHCVTEASMVPKQEHGEDDCKITKMDRQGDTVNWSSVCDSPRTGKMTAVGTAKYSGETMTSTTHMTGTDRRGKPIDITQDITGHYVGACPK